MLQDLSKRRLVEFQRRRLVERCENALLACGWLAWVNANGSKRGRSLAVFLECREHAANLAVCRVTLHHDERSGDGFHRASADSFAPIVVADCPRDDPKPSICAELSKFG